MNIFRQLCWELTLSYTLVTLGTLVVISLVLGGILLIRILSSSKLPSTRIFSRKLHCKFYEY